MRLEGGGRLCASIALDVQASRPKAVAIVLERFINSQPPEDPSSAGFRLMGACFMRFSFLAFLFLISTSPCLAIDGADMPPNQPQRVQAKLSCFSVQPEKGAIGKKIEELPSCDELCGKKGAACTAVQSAISPPPTCGDHITENYGSCRCCEVKP